MPDETTARRAGRRFGPTVGGAFALLGLVALWRGSPRAGHAMLGVGLALAVGGLVAPTRLGPVERAWMRMAHAISRVTTPVMLGAIWLVVIVPTALLRRAIGAAPLARPAERGGYWVRRDAPRSDMDRQF